jgi:hypothetical protein
MLPPLTDIRYGGLYGRNSDTTRMINGQTGYNLFVVIWILWALFQRNVFHVGQLVLRPNN